MAQLRRNQQFVGREADLLALAGLLKGGEAVAVSQAPSAVASGLGGIGKTQLAIEFAYRYGQYFAGVFWLNFAQAGSVPTEIARCGGAAHLQLFTEAADLSLDEQAALGYGNDSCKNGPQGLHARAFQARQAWAPVETGFVAGSEQLTCQRSRLLWHTGA